jgi:quercetin dioxygenase-like cupin family protein
MSPSHPNVAEEFIFVTEGELRMTIDDKEYLLPPFGSMKFKGDAVHRYANPGDRPVAFQNIIKYL